MIHNLYAAYRVDSTLDIASIRLNDDIRIRTLEVFENQFATFTKDVIEEIEYDPGWTPDRSQLMTIPIDDETQTIFDAVAGNFLSLSSLHPTNFEDFNIRALFTTKESESSIPTILVQRFTAGQILSRKFAFIARGDRFNRLEEPAFALSNSLVCVIEDGKYKFRSLHLMKQIFDLAHVISEATEEEVANFATHNLLDVWDQDEFVEQADDISRRLMYQITQSSVLEDYTAKEIQDIAKTIDFEMDVSADRLVVPPDQKTRREFLRVLNDDRFRGALSGHLYETNSKRSLS